MAQFNGIPKFEDEDAKVFLEILNRNITREEIKSGRKWFLNTK